jgi:hypothetical protein
MTVTTLKSIKFIGIVILEGKLLMHAQVHLWILPHSAFLHKVSEF